MFKATLLFCFLLLSLSIFSQKRIKGTSYTSFRLELKKDTIDFAIADTNLTVTKPLLIFCQGSGSIPLFIDFGENDIWPVPLNNFNLENLNKDYHVAVISMPKIPLIASINQLNRSYNYITDTTYQHSYSSAYLEANYLDNYVNRANKVLNFLRKQKWINVNKIVVAGHSQGGRVASKLAATNKHITELGLFGSNPFGRIDIMIRQARYDAQQGKISWEEAHQKMNNLYQVYKEANNKDSIRENPHFKTLNSFSEPYHDDLLKLDIPIYVAYGTDDIQADLCDLLPIFFLSKGKNNLTLKRYLHLEHNFFEVDENGKVNHDLAHWESVMDEFLLWLK